MSRNCEWSFPKTFRHQNYLCAPLASTCPVHRNLIPTHTSKEHTQSSFCDFHHPAFNYVWIFFKTFHFQIILKVDNSNIKDIRWIQKLLIKIDESLRDLTCSRWRDCDCGYLRCDAIFKMVTNVLITLKMESIRSSETPVTTYKTTRHLNPEDRNFTDVQNLHVRLSPGLLHNPQ
jgi:hypothetical protein